MNKRISLDMVTQERACLWLVLETKSWHGHVAVVEWIGVTNSSLCFLERPGGEQMHRQVRQAWGWCCVQRPSL